MRVHLTKYSIDISTSEGKSEYAKIAEHAKSLGYRLFRVIGETDPKKDYVRKLPETLTIETDCLFADQYNTAEGFRIHDWYEGIVPHRDLRIGYYISGGDLEELATAKRDQLVCGYCGDRSGQHGQAFCSKCLDSPYLKRGELHLLRLRPVAEERKPNRPPLAEAEAETLGAAYTQAQTEGATRRGKERLRKQREKIQTEREQTIEQANEKADGLLWLMDHGISIGNVIYYSHTRTFSFGWRTPVDEETRSAILGVISGFPFAYEIKCDDGKTLSGNVAE